MSTQNLGWLVTCDDCGTDAEADPNPPTSAGAIALAIESGWTSLREKVGTSWRRVERCPACFAKRMAGAPIETSEAAKVQLEADQARGMLTDPQSFAPLKVVLRESGCDQLGDHVLAMEYAIKTIPPRHLATQHTPVVMTDPRDLQRLGDMVAELMGKCPHGFQRHRLDGGMAPGCSACVDAQLGVATDPDTVTFSVRAYPEAIVLSPLVGIPAAPYANVDRSAYPKGLDIPGPHRCSSCAPEYSCFADPSKCCKPIPATALTPGPNASWQCSRCQGVFELAGGALEHTEFECEANQARGVR